MSRRRVMPSPEQLAARARRAEVINASFLDLVERA